MSAPDLRVVIRRTGSPRWPWEARCTGCRLERVHIDREHGAVAVNTRGIGIGNASHASALAAAAAHLRWHRGGAR